MEEAVDSQESLEEVKENTGTAEPTEGFVWMRTLCGEGVPGRSKAGKPAVFQRQEDEAELSGAWGVWLQEEVQASQGRLW